MKTNQKQAAYEAPEMESVELRTEVSFMSCPADCGGVHTEDVCDDCNRD